MHANAIIHFSGGDAYIQSQIELIPSTQTLLIKDQFLSSAICRPLFKAIHFQSNLRTIDLTNSFIEDDGLKHLSQALPTLVQLCTLNLNGNLITSIGIKHILSAFDGHPNCLGELRELYLSYNPLHDASLMPLSSICDKLTALTVLHLASTGLTNLKEFDLKFATLTELDLGYNNFVPNGLSKAIAKLDANHLARLNLSFYACYAFDADDSIDEGGSEEAEKPIIEALVRCLNAGTCANLEDIRLSGCQLNDADCGRLIQPISRSKVLRNLVVSDNSQLTKLTFKHILESVPMKNLHIEGCKMILTGWSESDVDTIKVVSCPENIVMSLSTTRFDSEEIEILKKLWLALSRGRGKLFVRSGKALLTLKSDSYNKVWGHSLC